MVAGASVLMPYLLFSCVHGRQQAGAALLAVEGVEEVERVQAVGDQIVQVHADEVGVVVLLAGRAGFPKAAQRGNQRGIVLALGEPQLGVPAARGHAVGGDRHLLAARPAKPMASPIWPAHSLCERSRMAALCSSLCATA